MVVGSDSVFEEGEGKEKEEYSGEQAGYYSKVDKIATVPEYGAKKLFQLPAVSPSRLSRVLS